MQTEVRSVVDFVRQKFGNIRKMWIIDYHTGLGSWMQESLILDEKTDQNTMFECLGRNVVVEKNSEYYYKINGSISEAFRNAFPDKKINYVVAEYGTRHALKVISKLALETVEFHKKPGVINPKIHRDVLDCFFPDSEAWQKTVPEYGFQVFLKVLNYSNQFF